MAEVTEREIKAALDMEDAREKREEDDGFLGWNLHNRRKCRCWERRPGQQMCMGCERVMANAQLIAECVAEEREACAMLHESVPNECDRDLRRLTVTGCGCGAMGAVIAYRDAIRKRGQRG